MARNTPSETSAISASAGVRLGQDARRELMQHVGEDDARHQARNEEWQVDPAADHELLNEDPDDTADVDREYRA